MQMAFLEKECSNTPKCIMLHNFSCELYDEVQLCCKSASINISIKMFCFRKYLCKCIEFLLVLLYKCGDYTTVLETKKLTHAKQQRKKLIFCQSL